MAVEVIPGSLFQPDVTLTYKGTPIVELDATGTKIIKTAGKYCESDIELIYIKRSIRTKAIGLFYSDIFFTENPIGGIVTVESPTE